MKRILLGLAFVLIGLISSAQPFQNSWINYSQPYYKFNVGANGLYRISQPVLVAAGLGSVDASHFQLWRHGVEIPLFTSVPNGALGASDFLEFYGQRNDGAADTRLYKFDSLQMSTFWSLYTDTAAYFLTVRSSGSNLRYTDPGNNVAANVLPADSFFLHRLGNYYRNTQSLGFGVNLGEIVRAASYEHGEGWTSNAFGPGAASALSTTVTGMNIFANGPNASFQAVVAGAAGTFRNVSASLNGTALTNTNVDGYTKANMLATNIPLSSFTGGNATIAFSHTGISSDRVVVSHFEITYPRNFNFSGQTQFAFTVPSSGQRYLEISNFSVGTGQAILFDLTNRLRIVGDIQGGIVRIVLPASTSTRNLVLVATQGSSRYNVTQLTTRNFINYSSGANQGNLIIISHPLLYNDGNGINQVERYANYRASAAGGSYSPVIIDIDQVIDQFGWGIKHHPHALRAFTDFVVAQFNPTPQAIYLIGKGLNYQDFRRNESDPNVVRQAMIPTFGKPSSDNLLTATRTGWSPRIPIGRLSAITGAEVRLYLDKVIQYEQAQQSTNQSFESKAWMKNIGQLTGGLDDPGLFGLITSYMQGYEEIIADTLFGGNVYQFNKNAGTNLAVGRDKTLNRLFDEGASIINYFGHSSPNNIEFNLDNPQNYNNTGRYPLIIINGCNSGDLFTFDTLRALSSGTLSEKFVFATQKGSIGYIASTHYGLPAQLNYFNTWFYRNISKDQYGQTLGRVMQTTMQQMASNYSTDYIAQTHAEEITLHGDPLLRLNPHPLPDFIINDSLLTTTPARLSVADQQVTITARIANIGKAVRDSITIQVQHRLPDSSLVLLGNYRIRAVRFMDSLVIPVTLNPLRVKGWNEIIVRIDPQNQVSEMSEANNQVIKRFEIREDELRPVWPYNYAIVTDPTAALYASTANPVLATRSYIMELDTTATFNSTFKVTRLVSDSGGVIRFTPGINYTDSTVYYWRVAPYPTNASTVWNTSSFVYIQGGSAGFNQSHFYQFRNNNFVALALDSNTRKLNFNERERRLLIRTGLWPFYGWDQINVNLDDTQLDYYGCVYGALQFVVYDSLTLQPWKNVNVDASFGRFQSARICDGASRNFFEFRYTDSASRRRAMQFFDSIPSGCYVSVTNLGWTNPVNCFVPNWKADSTLLGAGRSLWHTFLNNGLYRINDFNSHLPFAFVFRKGDTTRFVPQQYIGPAVNNQISETFYMPGKQVEGTMTTPWMGPAKAWNRLRWDAAIPANNTTNQRIDVIGRDAFGNDVVLASVYESKDTSISYINATTYPFLRLQLNNDDNQQARPSDLRHWQLTGTLVPEGAIAPNMALRLPDTLIVNDTLFMRVGFKNVSRIAFDSIRVRLTITDNNGNNQIINNLQNGGRLRPLAGSDSLIISYDIPLAGLFGVNQLKLEVNPDNAQPEQFLFNNLLFHRIVVTNSTLCPGSSPSFTAPLLSGSPTYRWQINTGSGFTDLTDGGIYAGTGARTINLANVPTSMTGTKFRCRITTTSGTSFSPEFLLKFQLNWTGAISDAWENPANWSCNTIPDGFTDVLIPGLLARYPVIRSAASARSVTAKTSAQLTITDENSLLITGPPGGE
jgi:hypothetical protein